MSPTTACWLARSRLVSGSSHSSSRGSSASACPTRSRCCSPPESSPTGSFGEVARADGVDEAIDALRVAAPRERQTEPVAVDAERDEVAAAQGRLGRQRALLGDVADATVAAPADGFAQRSDAALAERLEPEDRAQQGGLSRTAGAEHGDQLAGLDGEIEAAPQLRSPRRSAAPAISSGRDRAAVIAPARPRARRCSPASTRGKSGRPAAFR